MMSSKNSNSVSRISILLALFLLAGFSRAFLSVRPPASATTATTNSVRANGIINSRLHADFQNNIERLEFKIHPDGRVEELVRGIKGSDCLKLTEKLNEALGEVISSQPTEEMFEQDLTIDQTVTNRNTESGDGDSWEGASSW